jgi:hypothetical protein
MIFFFWYSAWLISASTIFAYAIPYLAIIARTTYFEHKARFINLSHLAIGLILFLWLSLVSSNPFENSVILSLRVIGFMAFTFYISRRINDFPLEKCPRSIGAFLFFIDRYFRLVNEKRIDFQYTVNSRLVNQNYSGFSLLRHRVVLTFRAFVSATLDAVLLVNLLVTIIIARGGLPHLRNWQKGEMRQSSLLSMVVADLCLLSLLFLTLFFTWKEIIPKNLIDLGKYFQSLL